MSFGFGELVGMEMKCGVSTKTNILEASGGFEEGVGQVNEDSKFEG
jgi:hypothetical protein